MRHFVATSTDHADLRATVPPLPCSVSRLPDARHQVELSGVKVTVRSRSSMLSVPLMVPDEFAEARVYSEARDLIAQRPRNRKDQAAVAATSSRSLEPNGLNRILNCVELVGLENKLRLISSQRLR
jgi:hypothetical protein